MSQAVVHPKRPWVNHTLKVDPRGETGLGNFTLLGQAPTGTVDVVTTDETIHADVTSPEGYFVVLADLPVDSSPPPNPPPLVDVFLRIDAYAADGTLLAPAVSASPASADRPALSAGSRHHGANRT